MLVIGLASILLLSLVPVVGTHVLSVADAPFAGSDHLGALCLIALHELLSPAHLLLHWLVGAGVAWALFAMARQTYATRRVLRGLPVRALGETEQVMAERAGLRVRDVLIVHGLPIPAFTAGPWLRPRVYLADALINGPQALSVDEVTAVLAHEAAHVRRRDPLRFLLLRALSRVLFWIPALHAVAEDIADEAEIAADDAASLVSGPVTVASALVKVGAWRAPSSALSAVGFVRRDLLDRRVRRLIGEAYRPQSRLTGRAVCIAALALSVSTLSGVVDVHDLPSAPGHPTSHRHCEHEGMFSASHLFCRWTVDGAFAPPGAADCPHAGS